MDRATPGCAGAAVRFWSPQLRVWQLALARQRCATSFGLSPPPLAPLSHAKHLVRWWKWHTTGFTALGYAAPTAATRGIECHVSSLKQPLACPNRQAWPSLASIVWHHGSHGDQARPVLRQQRPEKQFCAMVRRCGALGLGTRHGTATRVRAAEPSAAKTRPGHATFEPARQGGHKHV